MTKVEPIVPETITMSQACALLGLSRFTIMKHVEAGDIRKVGAFTYDLLSVVATAEKRKGRRKFGRPTVGESIVKLQEAIKQCARMR